jgi:hypothetical protein
MHQPTTYDSFIAKALAEGGGFNGIAAAAAALSTASELSKPMTYDELIESAERAQTDYAAPKGHVQIWRGRHLHTLTTAQWEAYSANLRANAVQLPPWPETPVRSLVPAQSPAPLKTLVPTQPEPTQPAATQPEPTQPVATQPTEPLSATPIEWTDSRTQPKLYSVKEEVLTKAQPEPQPPQPPADSKFSCWDMEKCNGKCRNPLHTRSNIMIAKAMKRGDLWGDIVQELDEEEHDRAMARAEAKPIHKVGEVVKRIVTTYIMVNGKRIN